MATTASLPAYSLPGVTVYQPPHLEGNAELATEILPGPPSSAAAQQTALKRDPKKPSVAYSYLPPSDPGSTYSGLTHGTLIGQDLEGPHSKRSRIDKGTGRAQRASARNQGAHNSPSMDLLPHIDFPPHASSQSFQLESDSGPLNADKEASDSRSNSSLNLLDPPAAAVPAPVGRPKRKDKGKAKEVDNPPLRVKEEPKSFSLHTPDVPNPNNLLFNEDHCSSCRSYGSLVYCDGCPRAFHFWCLDPPLEGVDDDRNAPWYCSTCMARKHPPRRGPPSLLSGLIYQLQTINPVEFQLPEDIRTYFKDVGSGPRGTYIDSSEIKPPRLNRHGQLEDRDPYRLRDRNSGPVLCFQCSRSSLPDSLTTTTTPAAKRARRSTSQPDFSDAGKSIVSCDYCNLHWHLDCLDPPLLTLPQLNKKWMCPNHAERVMPLKRRIPKQHTAPIEITKPREYNNGNIEVIPSQLSSAAPTRNVVMDEVLINGRRYRVPERFIILDFWNKLNKWDEHLTKEGDLASGTSSPLTSLSSLEEEEDHMMSNSARAHREIDEISAAQLLCNLSHARRPERSHSYNNNGPVASKLDRGTQTDQDPPKPLPTKNKVGRPRKHPIFPEAVTNGAASKRASESTATSSSVTISAVRRRRASQNVNPESSTRELRSRSRNHNNDTPLTSISSRSSLRQADDSSKDNLSTSGTIQDVSKPGIVNVKLEEIEGPSFSGFLFASPSTGAKTKPIRTPRQTKQKEPDGSSKDTKEKRGRKRKVRDDELPVSEATNGAAPIDHRHSSKKGKEEKVDKTDKSDQVPRKSTRTPARHVHGQLQVTQETTPISTSTPPHSPSLSITPSLKIRLPRLSNLGSISLSSNHLETPSRR